MMTKDELISEIDKALGEMPEIVLMEILRLLKQKKDQSSNRMLLLRNLNSILDQDRDLLERLAS
jgi:hypothetical protein